MIFTVDTDTRKLSIEYVGQFTRGELASVSIYFKKDDIAYRLPSGTGIAVNIKSWTAPGGTLLCSSGTVTRPDADGTPYTCTINLNTAQLLALFTSAVQHLDCSIEVQWEVSPSSATYHKTARKKIRVEADSYRDGDAAPSVTPIAGLSFVTTSTEGDLSNEKVLTGTAGNISVTAAASTATLDLVNTAVTPGVYTSANITVDAKGRITAAANGSGGGGGSGTVTSVAFTGGIISVANGTTAAALTVAGTSGGIPYFSGTTTWATSALLAANTVMVGGGAGLPPATASGVTISGGVITATGFSGPLTGNVTGNVSGSSGSCTGNAATATLASTVTVASEASDATCFPLFTTAATGNLAPKTNPAFAFDSTSRVLSLGQSGSSGQLLLFNGSGVSSVVLTCSYSGGGYGGTVNFAGAGTVITTGNLSSITAVGTVTSGTWNGTAIGAAYGGTGVANNAASTITISGNFATTFTVTGTTGVTLPTSGTLATLAGSESLTNKKLGSLTTNGFVRVGSGNGTLSSSAFALADLPTQADGTCLANVSGSTAVPSAQPFVFRKLDLGSGNYAYAGCDFTGNARGINAIDIQSVRTVGTRVASGSKAVCVGTDNTGAGGADTAIGAVNTVSSSGGSNTSIGATNTISGTGLGSAIVGFTNTVSSDYGYSAIVGYNNSISAHYGESVAIGVGNTVSGAYMKWGIAIGDSNTVSGYQSAAIGTGIVQSGDTSYAFGKEVKNTVASVAEIGFFTGSTRNSAIRLHSANGLVTFTCVNSGTALTDGGTPAGSEANGTLMRNGWSLRRNGYALYIDVNSGGTVKTLSLGTAV